MTTVTQQKNIQGRHLFGGIAEWSQTRVIRLRLHIKQAQRVGLSPDHNSHGVVVKNLEYSNDVMMSAIASQNTSLPIVNAAVYSGTDERKHQSSASLAFVRGIHRWPVNSPHKWPVTRKMFPFNDVIINNEWYYSFIYRYHILFIYSTVAL